MTVYSPTPTWPPKTLSDNEQILDFMRQQIKRQLEDEQQAKAEQGGVKGVRQKLADAIEDAERLEDFPEHVLTLMRVTYDALWVEMSR